MSGTNNSGDWRSKCKSTIEQWAAARENGYFTDVTFSVGPEEAAKTYKAHKVILAMGSPVFEAMFYGSLPEWKNPILIPDIEPEVFEILLRYLYGEKTSFPSISRAFGVCIVAEKYIVPALKAATEEYISRMDLHNDTVWSIVKQAALFNMADVKKNCLQYIARNAQGLLSSDELMTIPADVMEEVLQTEQLCASETHILHKIAEWGHANTIPGQSLKDRIKLLLRHVHFTVLSLDEFCRFTDRHPGLIGHHDAMAIMKHLHNRSIYQLPEWCCNRGSRFHAFVFQNSNRECANQSEYEKYGW